jgi:hypothetical protein
LERFVNVFLNQEIAGAALNVVNQALPMVNLFDPPAAFTHVGFGNEGECQALFIDLRKDGTNVDGDWYEQGFRVELTFPVAN